MPFCKTNALLVFTVFSIRLSATVHSEILTVSDEGNASTQHYGLAPTLSEDQPAFMPAMDSLFSPSALAVFHEDITINEHCLDLLKVFQDRYSAHVNCLVPAARPVKVCLSCFESYAGLSEIYANISTDQIGNCRDSLLRNDRLMLIYLLYDNMHAIWKSSACEQCVAEQPTNATLDFMNEFNQSLSCFEKYSQGNHSDLCLKCKSQYEGLNVLYGRIAKEKLLCIDIEDAMNVTRRLWSKKFDCIAPREEKIPVIAVSCFMLFLPIIFYLSSYLHSEQKKLKLIHPKRAKSNTSLLNVQDKFS